MFWCAVIGRENHQGLIEANGLFDMRKQIGERPVEPAQIVLGLKARGAENVANIIGR